MAGLGGSLLQYTRTRMVWVYTSVAGTGRSACMSLKNHKYATDLCRAISASARHRDASTLIVLVPSRESQLSLLYERVVVMGPT